VLGDYEEITGPTGNIRVGVNDMKVGGFTVFRADAPEKLLFTAGGSLTRSDGGSFYVL
jgi:hypothetical protein